MVVSATTTDIMSIDPCLENSMLYALQVENKKTGMKKIAIITSTPLDLKVALGKSRKIVFTLFGGFIKKFEHGL